MPKVSVIIPVYNVGNYLRECLDSVINQTLKEIEIICVNDGSTDNSLEILQEYALKDNRITMISQENQGQGIARNKGIEISKGEYVLFIDPDDWIELKAIEFLYNYSKKYNTDFVEFLFDRYLPEKDDFYTPKFDYSYKENVIYTNNDLVKNIFRTPLLTCNKIYKHDFLIKNNIRYDNSRLGEDHIVTIKTRLLAERAAFFNKILYHYRVNPLSSCNSVSSTKLEIFNVIKRIKQELVDLQEFDSLKKDWSKYIIDFILWNCYSVPQDMQEHFDQKCQELLSPKEYKKYLEMKNDCSNLNLLEHIFSIKNSENKMRKIVTIMGIKIKFKKGGNNA